MSKNQISLAEVMGKEASGGNLSLSKLSDILGDNTPNLPRNAVGRHRLVRALQQRFGQNWRSLPGVSDIVKEFDGEVELEKKIARIKAVRPKGGNRGGLR